jgi:hypothetical protein
LPKSSYPPVTEFRSQNLEKPRLLLPIILLFKPLVEILRLTLLSLVVVVSKIHSFEEGNCGGQLLLLAEKAKVRRTPAATAQASWCIGSATAVSAPSFVFTTKPSLKYPSLCNTTSVFIGLLPTVITQINLTTGFRASKIIIIACGGKLDLHPLSKSSSPTHHILCGSISTTFSLHSFTACLNTQKHGFGH